MRVLVTGGAGYIGSVLVPLLLDRGHHVAVVDNFMYGQTSLLDVCHHSALSIYRMDVRYGGRELEQLIVWADAILPLACVTGAPACACDPDTATAINLLAIQRLAQSVSSSQWILFPNTNSGYGTTSVDQPCTEETPLAPVSLYGRLKGAAEQHLLDHHENTLVFRLATVFGMSPRMRLDLLVNEFVYRAVTDHFIVLYEADFMRNYVHVRDVARVFVHGIDHFPAMVGQTYNVGRDDANCSKRELCQRIQRYVSEFQVFEAPVAHDPDRRNYVVSNTKLATTGFTPRYSLDDGIQEMLRGYQVVRSTAFHNAA